jgi:hypothetical protein
VRNLRALAVIILVTLCILTVLDIVEASAWAR